ncbi:MAG TPA: hypothetical protein PKY59_24575, partial [Pyrinomonadaceae bacterium]|nr:hypothetical protein [Pyrinomonadaceae bacterium]
MKSYLIIGLLAFGFLLSFSTNADAQRVLGGYKSIATDNAEVVAAAEFAVGNRVENNTEQEGLELASVDKAEMQTVAGVNYRLCLTVKLDEEEQQVQVIVFKSLQKE